LGDLKLIALVAMRNLAPAVGSWCAHHWRDAWLATLPLCRTQSLDFDESQTLACFAAWGLGSVALSFDLDAIESSTEN